MRLFFTTGLTALVSSVGHKFVHTICTNFKRTDVQMFCFQIGDGLNRNYVVGLYRTLQYFPNKNLHCLNDHIFVPLLPQEFWKRIARKKRSLAAHVGRWYIAVAKIF